MRRVLIALLACAGALCAGVPQFRDGDTVVFLGDSITHSRKWHRYVMDYYLTRFPERRIGYVNAGSSGDTASGALARLDRDVLNYRPSVVVIMLGMNDVKRDLYAPGEASAATLAARRAALETYRTKMAAIAARLREGGVRDLIFVISSPFDDTAEMETANLPGVNAALVEAGGILRQLAERVGASVIDFNGPMTAINREHQKTDPKFTLVGSDRVHPGEPGMLLMAYLFLKAQEVPALVSENEVDARNSFEVTRRELPMAFDPPAVAALGWAPIAQDLNREVLRVKGLAAGIYRLRIDGQAVAELDAQALADGVNLAAMATPQRRQAEEIVAKNEERRVLMVQLRDVAKLEDTVPGFAALSGDAEKHSTIDAWLEKLKARDEGQWRYYSGLAQRYFQYKPEVEAIAAKIRAISAELNAPRAAVTRHYELTPDIGKP